MTPDQFRAWLDRMGLSQRQAAAELDVNLSTIVRYLKGEFPISRERALACAALENLRRLPDYVPPKRGETDNG